jgi:hypothetical protein
MMASDGGLQGRDRSQGHLPQKSGRFQLRSVLQKQLEQLTEILPLAVGPEAGVVQATPSKKTDC